MNDLAVLDKVLTRGETAISRLCDLLITSFPPSVSADPTVVGKEIWAILNHVHHREGSDPEFVSKALSGCECYLKLAHNILFKLRLGEAFVILYEPMSQPAGDSQSSVTCLYWDRDMTNSHDIAISGVYTGETFWHDVISSSCQTISLPAVECEVVFDSAQRARLQTNPLGGVAVSFLDAFAPTFVNALARKYKYHEDFREYAFENAYQEFFIRKVDGVRRNLLWERFLHLNSLRGVEYLSPRDVPFDVVCGYIHGRARRMGVPLVFTPEMSSYLASGPFSFQYFHGSPLSIFMLADFAADFSRLACVRDRDLLLREATAIFDAYLDENVRFAQASMGRAYHLLCETDPHERDGMVMSNFLATGYSRARSEKWIDADPASVAAYVANVSARLVANQAALSVIPACWHSLIVRGLERAATLSGSIVPHFGGDEAARGQIRDNIRHLHSKYEHAVADGLGRVDADDLGARASGLNVLTLGGGSGLAENGRMLWREITKKFAARLVEIDFGRGKSRRLSASAGRPTRDGRTVNVFAFNGDLIVDACVNNPLVCREDAYNIGFLLWETSHPPETYINGVLMLDEIWVPSSYLVDVFRKLVPEHVEVINVGKHISVHEGHTYGVRDRLGIDPETKIFLAIGDFGSSLARKNIEATVDAFQKANPGRGDAALIIKIRQIDRLHWSNQNGLWERIERKIKGDSRIHVLQGNLSVEEYWGLMGDIDCMISLHRSEGFGYGLAHSHGLGKKTIVSDYSAVRDFCTAETSFLVPCEEVLVNPIDMNCREYIGVWGEPDVDAAAAAIVDVVAEPRGQSEMGEAARARFHELYAGDRFLNIIDERLTRALAL